MQGLRPVHEKFRICSHPIHWRGSGKRLWLNKTAWDQAIKEIRKAGEKQSWVDFEINWTGWCMEDMGMISLIKQFWSSRSSAWWFPCLRGSRRFIWSRWRGFCWHIIGCCRGIFQSGAWKTPAIWKLPPGFVGNFRKWKTGAPIRHTAIFSARPAIRQSGCQRARERSVSPARNAGMSLLRERNGI